MVWHKCVVIVRFKFTLQAEENAKFVCRTGSEWVDKFMAEHCHLVTVEDNLQNGFPRFLKFMDQFRSASGKVCLHLLEKLSIFACKG